MVVKILEDILRRAEEINTPYEILRERSLLKNIDDLERRFGREFAYRLLKIRKAGEELNYYRRYYYHNYYYTSSQYLIIAEIYRKLDPSIDWMFGETLDLKEQVRILKYLSHNKDTLLEIRSRYVTRRKPKDVICLIVCVAEALSVLNNNPKNFTWLAPPLRFYLENWNIIEKCNSVDCVLKELSIRGFRGRICLATIYDAYRYFANKEIIGSIYSLRLLQNQGLIKIVKEGCSWRSYTVEVKDLLYEFVKKETKEFIECIKGGCIKVTTRKFLCWLFRRYGNCSCYEVRNMLDIIRKMEGGRLRIVAEAIEDAIREMGYPYRKERNKGRVVFFVYKGRDMSI